MCFKIKLVVSCLCCLIFLNSQANPCGINISACSIISGINNFTITGDSSTQINNTTGCNGNPINNYSYLSPVKFSASGVYNFTIIPNSTSIPLYSVILVDWNNDNDYFDSNEFYDYGSNIGTFNANLVIPPINTTGIFTFAVMSVFDAPGFGTPITQTNLCTNTFISGELEEYQLEIIQPCIGALGCTNPNYCEYDSNAICDDGSCLTIGISGCTDPNFCEYNPNAICDNGSCITSNADPGICNTDCTLGPIETWNYQSCSCQIDATFISGCTNPNFCEYNPNANCNDGSCMTSNADPGIWN